ncbi:MAG: serine/threonine-protein kinase [Halioglobus sp.]
MKDSKDLPDEKTGEEIEEDLTQVNPTEFAEDPSGLLTEPGTELVVDLGEVTKIGDSPASEQSGSRQASSNEFVIKDRFVLEERLGRGGQGQIYKARDLRKEEAKDDNPYLAIKFLGEDFSRHPMALISLQREAKKSQQLAHPNILTVYDFDRDGDRVYMTMELLDGAPLSKWKSLEFAEDLKPTISALIEQMADGLAYAHQHGVVHSDFKPDNVFVTNEGRVKVLDFGIARIVDSATQSDSFDAGDLGALTLRYASLEMLEGGHDPQPSDDVYALGLVAYQLYTGNHPYDGKTAEEAFKSGLIAEPIKEIKRHQWKAIERAIALKRESRTESAEKFLREYQGTPIRNRVLAVAVLVLAISSAYFGYQSTQTEGPAIPFAELPAVEQAEFNNAMDLGEKSAAIQDWDGASRYYLAAYELHPRNADAEAGLEQLAEYLLTAAPRMTSERQKEYLLTLIQSFSANEYLANHVALNDLKARIEIDLGQ